MENASYPVGICAERCALATAVVSGFFICSLFVCELWRGGKGRRGEGAKECL